MEFACHSITSLQPAPVIAISFYHVDRDTVVLWSTKLIRTYFSWKTFRQTLSSCTPRSHCTWIFHLVTIKRSIHLIVGCSSGKEALALPVEFPLWFIWLSRTEWPQANLMSHPFKMIFWCFFSLFHLKRYPLWYWPKALAFSRKSIWI